MIKQLLLVGLGSAIGGALRYGISLAMKTEVSRIPWNTLAVNLGGSLLIGLIMGIAERSNANGTAVLFVATGFCGGFTTFSAFSLELVNMLHLRMFGAAALYGIASLVVGVLLCGTGLILGKNL